MYASSVHCVRHQTSCQFMISRREYCIPSYHYELIRVMSLIDHDPTIMKWNGTPMCNGNFWMGTRIDMGDAPV